MVSSQFEMNFGVLSTKTFTKNECFMHEIVDFIQNIPISTYFQHQNGDHLQFRFEIRIHSMAAF